ncbi:MAG TPA: response regulator [Steroidobacteraceae bacterium]|jgi:two-component system chemotaxis response regulator CheY
MDNSKTILVVDDASLVRLYYRSILEPAGFRIEEAFNGIEALEKLRSVAVHLLIVDINMPLMDGLTMLDRLRQKELPLAATPALITSTESAEKDFAAARAAGANYYLVKPIDRDTLVHVASMLCGVSP